MKKKDYIPPVNDFIRIVEENSTYKNLDKSMLLLDIRKFIDEVRAEHIIVPHDRTVILARYLESLHKRIENPLRPLINATGIVLHTNLGRAPLSEHIYSLILQNCSGYTNLELSIETGKRTNRDDALRNIMRLVTGGEDIVVVNNNAAALYLLSKTFAHNKEIIVSRGELIEIGGTFRISEIIADGGAILKEVGTTNCTRISDYEKAINPNTAFIFKAHPSNFAISGHTASASLEELVLLSQKFRIPFIYDAGSGLLKKPHSLAMTKEPEIAECIHKGIDIVCFSGDKLLGSSQAGLIVGKAEYLQQLRKHPLMRVLRVDKFTLSSLFHSISLFMNDHELIKHNEIFKMLSQTEKDLQRKARKLARIFNQKKINIRVQRTKSQIGGGSLPEMSLPSYEIHLDLMNSESVYWQLLRLDKPILGILREQKLYLNVLTINEKDFTYLARIIEELKC